MQQVVLNKWEEPAAFVGWVFDRPMLTVKRAAMNEKRRPDGACWRASGAPASITAFFLRGVRYGTYIRR